MVHPSFCYMNPGAGSLVLQLLLMGAALLSIVCTACNTTKGLGKDVEKLGDKIQDKAAR